MENKNYDIETLVEYESKFDAAMARMDLNPNKENFAELERLDSIIIRCLQRLPDSKEVSELIRKQREKMGVEL